MLMPPTARHGSGDGYGRKTACASGCHQSPPRAAAVAAMTAMVRSDLPNALPVDAIPSHLVHRYLGFNELYQLRLDGWIKPVHVQVLSAS